MTKKKIYLDHGATTPVDKEVLEAMLPYFSEKYGNAASHHFFGKDGCKAVEAARNEAAIFFHANPEEIIFTSGATESNNLAVKGIIKRAKIEGAKPHIITTAFEHHCVLDACGAMQKEGLAEVTFLNPEADGVISVKSVEEAIKPNTVLISVMYVNNEIGTLQPIAAIGAMIKKENASRENKIYFHTDATQAVNYFNCDVDDLGVDMLSMSAHKIYGPKGVGLLYIRKGTLIARIQDGGDHEGGKRAGTLNVPGIVGLGKALELAGKNNKKDAKKIAKLRDRLIDRALAEIPDTFLNGSREFRSPNNANISFRNVEGESLLMLLDMAGIAVSTGSACSSDSLAPSHVLLAIGRKAEEAHGSIRMTLGKNNTEEEIDYTVEKLKESAEKIRKISGQVLDDFYKAKEKGVVEEEHERRH
ncbi:MAG: cysteine desulfurase family protein [Patescibacteria group bacterium]|jgi:cysteine desulfurase